MLLFNAIQTQPDYELFRRAFAERKAPLVIVCGSGLSASAKLPTWPKLRQRLESAAVAKVHLLNQMGAQLFTPKLEAAKSEKSPWVAFKLLKEILSPPTFNGYIEQELGASGDDQIPPSYGDLLRLSPRGVVTLNLDRFAGDAVAEAYSSSRTPITPVYGKELAHRWSQLRSAKTFLVYLHGGLHDTSTWVLTQDDLTELTKTEGHDYFLKNLFLEHLVLFIGVSADDISLSRKLFELKEGGFTPKMLFWLTTRLDADTTSWAATSNVCLIRYVAQNTNEHEIIIREFVDDCLKYVAHDELRPDPIQSNRTFLRNEIISAAEPEELAQEKPETIRKTLAALLQDRLSHSKDSEIYECYRQFCEEYEFALHRAFFKSSKEAYSRWFDYDLIFPALGKGNFGEVFAAKHRIDNSMVAIKIMHENIFYNDEMLGGFRRASAR